MKKIILIFISLSIMTIELLAMESVIDKAREAIKNEHIQDIEYLIELENFDPNASNFKVLPNILRMLNKERVSAIVFAVAIGKLKSVQFLISRTNNENLLEALLQSILKGNNKTSELLLATARERGLDIQPTLNQALMIIVANYASLEYGPLHVRRLLDLGANRVVEVPQGRVSLPGRTLIELAQEKIEEEELTPYKTKDSLDNAKEVLRLLRNYAPDLKTRTALNILNQVRTGQINDPNYFKNLPRDLMELMAKLASVDPEANEKWQAIGLPRWPEDFQEEVTFTRSAEKAIGEWE